MYSYMNERNNVSRLYFVKLENQNYARTEIETQLNY